ncbi:MAG: CapA family protein [Chloroflexus sp.]|nr:CapA family protein [Chloroflexus sp.]
MTGRLALLVLLLLTVLWSPVVAAQPPEGPRSALNRCGAGDTVQYTLAIAGAIVPDALNPGGIETPSYAEAFAPLRPFFTAADLGIATLAGPLAGGPLPALAAALAEHNLLLLGAAHPRLLDRGPSGVDATLQTLARYGIFQHGATGAGETKPPFLKVTIPHPQSPLTIGFLSATWGLDGNADPQGQLNLLADSAGVLPTIVAAIEQARRETDLVVVMAAWSQPLDPDPVQARVNAARYLIASGADLVIGSIPGELATVDWVRAADREGLVIFSAGDLVSATATSAALIYVGVTRDEDGSARLTGMRYLPITPGQGNRGPTPLSAVPRELSIRLGDPGQLHLVQPIPPTGKIEVCPPLILPEAPQTPISGDFARFYQTFGGEQARSLIEGIALLGLPLGAVTRELAGDCRQEVAVLYTERQRLELHLNNDWPNRVLGSHLGVVALRLTYPDQPVVPRTDLSDPQAFADPRFRSFYERYGGISLFGYPISGALSERDPNTGRNIVVQYFERARFELDPAAPLPDDPLWQVRLGLLGREVGAQTVRVLCPAAVAPTTNTLLTTAVPTDVPTALDRAAQSSGDGFSLTLFLIFVLIFLLIALILYALYDLYRFSEHYAYLSSLSHRRSGYRAADSSRPSPSRTVATRFEAWREQLQGFVRRTPAESSPAAEAEMPPPSSERSWLGRFFKRNNAGRTTTAKGPAWRRPVRTLSSSQAAPVTSVPQTQGPAHAVPDPDQALPTLPQGAVQQSPKGPSLMDNELAEWFDEPDSGPTTGRQQAGYSTEQPVDWGDLPAAERERWLAELGPLVDETAADVPPTERARWQSELAGTESDSATDHAPTAWTEHQAHHEDDRRLTRRLDESVLSGSKPASQTDDDDLLRELLGI